MPGLTTAQIEKPATDAWPTYNGDYSGRRFSPLTKINDRQRQAPEPGLDLPPPPAGPGRSRRRRCRSTASSISPRPITSGRSTRGPAASSGTTSGATRGGIHLGNRGAAIHGDWLYFETPDCHLVSLNIKDGKERWRKEICDLDD